MCAKILRNVGIAIANMRVKSFIWLTNFKKKADLILLKQWWRSKRGHTLLIGP